MHFRGTASSQNPNSRASGPPSDRLSHEPGVTCEEFNKTRLGPCKRVLWASHESLLPPCLFLSCPLDLMVTYKNAI